MSYNRKMAPAPPTALLLYDGICGLCNHAVRFVKQRDREHRFTYLPLQHPDAIALLRRHHLPLTNSTVVLVFKNRADTQSTAAMQIFRLLPYPWPWVATLMSLIPSPLRDAAYRCVASNRYRFFGSVSSCALRET